MCRFKNILLIVLFLSLAICGIYTQNSDSALISMYEQSLNELFDKISNNTNDSEKEKLNDKIIENFEEVLIIKGSFVYPFDSLKNLGKISSSNGRLRIYTWNLPKSDGTHKYFGYIQFKPKNEDNYLLFKLTDQSEILDSVDRLILADTCWFGTLYYEIIEKEHNDTIYYTLLGFDFNNLLTTKKIIEVLYFRYNKIPVFGKSMFSYQNELRSRIIFEFSSKAAMGLKYNNDLEMIVYDHLSPLKPSYEGLYMFYGPDFSYDGFKFNNGIWNEVLDVDVRNPAY
jgi:hypothetical protein